MSAPPSPKRGFGARFRRMMPNFLLCGMSCYVVGTLLYWLVGWGTIFLVISFPLLVISVPWAVVRFFRFFRDRFLFRVRNRILLFYLIAGVVPLLIILAISIITLYLFMINLSVFIYDNEMKNLGYRLTSLGAELMKGVYDQPDSREDPIYLHYYFNTVLTKRTPDLPPVHIMYYRMDETGHIQYVAVNSSLPPEQFQPEYLPDWLQQMQFSGVVLKHYSAFIYSHNMMQIEGEQFYLDLLIPFDDALLEYFRNSANLLSYVSIETQEKDSQAGLRHGSYKAFNGFHGAPTAPALSDLPGSERLFHYAGGAEGQYTIATVDTIPATDWFNREHHALNSTGKTLAVHLQIPLQTVLEYLSSRSYAGQIFKNALYFSIYFFLIVEVASLIVGFFIIRAVTRSFNYLYRGTQELRKGNFSIKIPVRRKDELGALSESFNAMSRSVRGLLTEVADKQRIRRELEIARQVQGEFFPKRLPEVPGLFLQGKCYPAREVSGDFYDFINRTDSILDILVGDISGKGISAALLMASLQSASRAQPPLEGAAGEPEGTVHQLESFLKALNRHLFNITPEEKFATLFYGRYCLNHNLFYFCNAGHESPILIHQDGSMERLEEGGTVMGIFPEAAFDIGAISLRKGDLLAVYTDGLVEAVDRTGHEFGEERLIQILLENQGCPGAEIHSKVMKDVQAWYSGVPQHDDITFVLIRFGEPVRTGCGVPDENQAAGHGSPDWGGLLPAALSAGNVCRPFTLQTDLLEDRTHGDS